MRITHGIPDCSQPAAVTIGNFDGVHLGHQAMLRQLVTVAQQRRLVPSVVTFEPHPREFFAPDKAPTRLTSLREKLQLLRAHGVQHVHVCAFNHTFAGIAAEDFVERFLWQGMQTRWLLVGDDFRFGARRAGDFDLLQRMGERAGIEVVNLPSICVGDVRVSSTAVREALAAGAMQQAAALLGQPYSISGRVMHGDKIGRQIGFPTANVQMKHNRPPVAGIFAVKLHGLADGPVMGAASVGTRPTVDNRGKAVLEVHLLNFKRDIYGEHVRVEFLHKLRDEEKYPDLATLTAQIARDVEQIKLWFEVNEHG